MSLFIALIKRHLLKTSNKREHVKFKIDKITLTLTKRPLVIRPLRILNC